MTDQTPAAPTISDEWIAERWPDQDPVEVRRRFDALMDKLGESPWRGMPRWPEVMQPVLAWAAMLPRERIELLSDALADVPEHLREQPWIATRPSWGTQSVKFENVHGDNGHGMGRQAVASTPFVKGYNLAPWIAAASPGNVAVLLAELERLSSAQIVPGVLKCAKCNFRLTKTTLTPSGAYANEEPDTCPNCSVPMWKVTWKDEAQEAYRVVESQMERALEAERTLEACREPIVGTMFEHDEAVEWITANCMAIRRDNGALDYSLGAMIKAYEAGKRAASIESQGHCDGR
jgi:hypothetical protein